MKGKNRRKEDYFEDRMLHLLLPVAIETMADENIVELNENTADISPMPDMRESLRAAVTAGKERKRHRRYQKILVTTVIGALLIFSGFAILRIYNVNKAEHSQHTAFTMPEQPEVIQPAYELMNIPDGFTYDSSNLEGADESYYFLNEYGDALLFSISIANGYAFDNEGQREDITLLNGNAAYYAQKNGQAVLFWREDEHFLSLSGPFDQETLLWIADGVRKK